jgi:hypothetical protein
LPTGLIDCCIRMVVRRAAPSSLRMIIRSIVEAARPRQQVILKFLNSSTVWSNYRRIDGVRIEVEVVSAVVPRGARSRVTH